MDNWTAADIPSQDGKLAIITGPTSGAGLSIALGLVSAGARLVLAARNAQKTQSLIEKIRAEFPSADVSAIMLDLANLASIRHFAETIARKYTHLDLLINNAGVAAIPYQRTVDGFEMQLGTNHLGHFALTGLLLPYLLAAPAPRVVTVASGASNTGRINFDDLQSEHRYSRYGAYAQSKLANLLFALELQRRAERAGLQLKSIASQPGWTATNLGPDKDTNPLEHRLWVILNRLFAHSPEVGAVPTLYAATVVDLTGGTYISPSGFRGLHGPPAPMNPGRAAQDKATAERLWAVSEALTGIHYEFSGAKTLM